MLNPISYALYISLSLSIYIYIHMYHIITQHYIYVYMYTCIYIYIYIYIHLLQDGGKLEEGVEPEKPDTGAAVPAARKRDRSVL